MARPLVDITGQKFGMLLVLSRGENNRSNEAQWACLCDCGRKTTMTGSHLRREGTRSCGCRRWPRKLAADIGYHGAHTRVKRARGKAGEHPCVDCGNQARDWSLRKDAPETHMGTKNGFSCAYSGDPDDYEPRCKRCHFIYDGGWG